MLFLRAFILIIALQGPALKTPVIKPQPAVLKTVQRPQPTKPETVYVRQLPHEKFFYKEDKPAFDVSFWLSMSAIAVSICAIILPIKANRRADKRAMFFKMYEAWNSSEVLAARKGYWEMVQKRKYRGKVYLHNLYDNHKEEYLAYETIFDVLSDTATLYLSGAADKKLIAYSFYTFILSYEESLSKDFKFYDEKPKHKIKMGEQFYANIKDLLIDVKIYRASRKKMLWRFYYAIGFKKMIPTEDDPADTNTTTVAQPDQESR